MIDGVYGYPQPDWWLVENMTRFEMNISMFGASGSGIIFLLRPQAIGQSDRMARVSFRPAHGLPGESVLCDNSSASFPPCDTCAPPLAVICSFSCLSRDPSRETLSDTTGQVPAYDPDYPMQISRRCRKGVYAISSPRVPLWAMSTELMGPGGTPTSRTAVRAALSNVAVALLCCAGGFVCASVAVCFGLVSRLWRSRLWPQTRGSAVEVSEHELSPAAAQNDRGGLQSAVPYQILE